jgi:2-oxoglutarate ferredoxin oxidoreductase subunit alpha
VIAAMTPGDAFTCAVEAARIAVKYVTPVMVLTDGYLANGSEPWRLPDVDAMPRIHVEHRTDPDGYQVYARNPETLARDWVIPGTPGLEHRIGGLEKDFLTGNVSYDPINHERMVKIRAEKVERVAAECGPLELCGDTEGDVLLVGWGGTFGALRQAATRMQQDGKRVSHVQLRYLWPFNPRLEPLLRRFDKVLVAELNMGQLLWLLRARYLIDAHGLNKIQGLPFKVSEIVDAVERLLDRSAEPRAAQTARNP